MATIHWPVTNAPDLYEIPRKRHKKINKIKKIIKKPASVYLQMNVDTKNSKMEKISQVAKVTHNQVHIEIKVSGVT